MSNKVKIFTIAEVPGDLMHSWLQHLRDFDTQHPGCHFVVAADAPDMLMKDMIEQLKVNPSLSFEQIFTRQREQADAKS
jgi:hypothetical protein